MTARSFDSDTSVALEEAQARIQTLSSELQQTARQRDECMRALADAHDRISDYHRKISGMERTVGQALLSSGDTKELLAKLDECQRTNQQYKESLEASEQRLAEFENTETRLHALTLAIQQHQRDAESQSEELKQQQERTCTLEQREAALEKQLKDAIEQVQQLLTEKTELQAQRTEALNSLNGARAMQKQSDAERIRLSSKCEDLQRCTAEYQNTLSALCDQLAEERNACIKRASLAVQGNSRFDAARHAQQLAEIQGLLDKLESNLTALRMYSCGVEGRSGQPGSLCEAFSRLHAVMDAAAKFTEEDDQQQSLYKSLRDLWATLECALAAVLAQVEHVTGGVRQFCARSQDMTSELQEQADSLQQQGRHSDVQLHEAQTALLETRERAEEELRTARRVAHDQLAELARKVQDQERMLRQAQDVLHREQLRRQELEEEFTQKSRALQQEVDAQKAVLEQEYRQRVNALHNQVAQLEEAQHHANNPLLRSSPLCVAEEPHGFVGQGLQTVQRGPSPAPQGVSCLQGPDGCFRRPGAAHAATHPADRQAFGSLVASMDGPACSAPLQPHVFPRRAAWNASCETQMNGSHGDPAHQDAAWKGHPASTVHLHQLQVSGQANVAGHMHGYPSCAASAGNAREESPQIFCVPHRSRMPSAPPVGGHQAPAYEAHRCPQTATPGGWPCIGAAAAAHGDYQACTADRRASQLGCRHGAEVAEAGGVAAGSGCGWRPRSAEPCVVWCPHTAAVVASGKENPPTAAQQRVQLPRHPLQAAQGGVDDLVQTTERAVLSALRKCGFLDSSREALARRAVKMRQEKGAAGRGRSSTPKKKPGAVPRTFRS